MIMFGDGATDLDARLEGPASAFIGYGSFAELISFDHLGPWVFVEYVHLDYL